MSKSKRSEGSLAIKAASVLAIFILVSISLNVVKAEGSDNPSDYKIVIPEGVVVDLNWLANHPTYSEYVKYDAINDWYEIWEDEDGIIDVLVEGTLVISGTLLLDGEIVVTGEIMAEKATFKPRIQSTFQGISINDAKGTFYQCQIYSASPVGIHGYITELTVLNCYFENCLIGCLIERSTNVDIGDNEFVNCHENSAMS